VSTFPLRLACILSIGVRQSLTKHNRPAHVNLQTEHQVQDHRGGESETCRQANPPGKSAGYGSIPKKQAAKGEHDERNAGEVIKAGLGYIRPATSKPALSMQSVGQASGAELGAGNGDLFPVGCHDRFVDCPWARKVEAARSILVMRGRRRLAPQIERSLKVF